MKGRLSRVTLVLMAGFVVGMSGCVTTSQIDEVKEMARQAQSDAAAAKQAASSADKAAKDAMSTANNAQRAANAAQNAANQANSCCVTNSEKIERMFKESMKK